MNGAPITRSHSATSDAMVPRYRPFASVILCVLLLTSSVTSSAIKEAIEEHLKDVAHDEGAESTKLAKQKGEKIHQLDSQVNDVHKNQFTKATDEANYIKKDHDLKSTSENDEYGGFNAMQDKAEESETGGFKRGHKKGHHKQGFQNSYHKDESSNKSTFFDDFNDEGDRAAYNNRLSSHDNQGGRSYKGAHNDGKEYLRDEYQAGGHSRLDERGDKRLGRQDYGRRYDLDDRLHHDKYQNGRNSYDRGKVHDRYDYHQPPPPPPPPPPPVPHDWGWQKWENRRDWERPPLQKGWDRDPAWDGYGYHDVPFRDDGYGAPRGYGYGYGYESRDDPIAQVPSAQAPNAPVVAHRKQTITIYEDPRYDGKDKGHTRKEEGDYLELEYRPSSQRYASYDDTYYNAPAPNSREGAIESSKINKLVYNYRRQ